MKNQFFKTVLAIVLTIVLNLVPGSAAFAATSSVNETAASDLHQDIYAEAKALADKKASVLTNFYNATSVQYALIDNGKIVISGQSGVFDKEETTELTNDTMYGIGSISKMYTTVAVMQLVDQGKVQLDHPVIEYIPDFVMSDSRYRDITVRMLLNHSSGLMGSTLNNSMLFEDNDGTTYTQFLDTLETQRLKADPGEFSVYCNDGFTLAQLLVERVSGSSFSDYIKNNISDPLELKSTNTPFEDFNRARLAKTYVNGFTEALPSEAVTMVGAGGIYSTAEDLCRFSDIFMDDSDTPVLSSSSVKAMENAEYRNNRIWPLGGDSVISYGLGWDSVNTYPFTQYGIKALVKGGDTYLYHSSLIVLPEENLAMAVITSGAASNYNRLMAQEVLLEVLQSKGRISEVRADQPVTKPVKGSMPENLKKYQGIYGCVGGIFKIEISDDGILTLTNTLSPASGIQKFSYTEYGKFYSSDGSTYVSLVNTKNGNTYLYVSAYGKYPSLGPTAISEYQLQKLKNNPIPEEIKAAWEKREGKIYFLISEKYSSITYLGTPFSQISLLNDLEGYCLYYEISDKYNAKSTFQIPGMSGRDLDDLTFFTLDQKQYLKTGSNILISEDNIKALPTKASFTCNIGENGYASWYRINQNSASKKIAVTVPKKASYSVYDKNGTPLFNSMIVKQTTVTLPSEGYIVFAGEKNAEFEVTYISESD